MTVQQLKYIITVAEIAGVTGLPLDDSCSMKSSSLQESSTWFV